MAEFFIYLAIIPGLFGRVFYCGTIAPHIKKLHINNGDRMGPMASSPFMFIYLSQYFGECKKGNATYAVFWCCSLNWGLSLGLIATAMILELLATP